MAGSDYLRLVASCTHERPLFRSSGRPRAACYGCWPKSNTVGQNVRDTSRPGKCAHCGSDYVSKIAAGKYCGDRCRVDAGNLAQASRIAAKKEQEPARLCAWCGSTFKRTYGDMRQRYCCHECEEARQNSLRSGSTHARRAKKFGVEYERVDRIAVFERDRWRCQLCKKKVTRDDAELDHIIPMSIGGAHTYANTQCSCRACNRSKGAKPLGQLNLPIAA